MSKGSITINSKTYREKTAIELLPSDDPIDIKANDEFPVLLGDLSEVLTNWPSAGLPEVSLTG